MKRVRYCVATSLDGFIAGPNGEIDWIVADPEIDFQALVNQFDTIFVGRKTYAPMVGTGHESFWGMDTYVFSRTLDPSEHSAVTVLREEFQDRVSAVREGDGKDIWLFGGGELFGSLAAAGLVDTVELAVIPVLLGSGLPVMPAGDSRVNLKLTKQSIYAATGTLALEYDVVG